jgi:hypothetical protein
MVSSCLWKIGRVSNRLLEVRNARSTVPIVCGFERRQMGVGLFIGVQCGAETKISDALAQNKNTQL